MKVGDKVEIIGGFDFLKGEVCVVLSVSEDKWNLFPIRVKSKKVEFATFAEHHLKIVEDKNNEQH